MFFRSRQLRSSFHWFARESRIAKAVRLVAAVATVAPAKVQVTQRAFHQRGLAACGWTDDERVRLPDCLSSEADDGERARSSTTSCVSEPPASTTTGRRSE